MSEAQLTQQGEDGWRRMLLSRPVRNEAATVISEEADHVRLELRLQKPAWLVPPLSWLIRPWWQQRLVTLHGPGYQVWQWCDGLLTVEEIADRFATRHRLTFHESRVAVTQYLSTLIRRGVLAILLPQPV